MSYSSKKITNSERDAKHVQAADDVLIGNAEDNKAVFDQLPELIVERHNELIDELDTPASTTHYGPTTLSSSVTSTSESMAATPKAVKTVYDLASQASVSAVEIKQKVHGTDTEDYVSAGNPALIGNYEFGTLGYVEAEDVHTGAQPIGVYFYVSDESINPLNTGYRLADGGIILVKFGADVKDNAVLDIYEEPHCATGNIPIYYNGSPITTGIISEDDIIALSYDSANNRWHAINRVYTDFVGGYSAAGNKAGLVPQPPTIAETGEYSILTSDGWLSAFPLQDNRIPWARKYSPAFTGTPTAPTAASGTSTTQIATTAFVQGAVSGISYSPFTGATTSADGTEGLVPAPTKSSFAKETLLSSDGTWNKTTISSNSILAGYEIDLNVGSGGSSTTLLNATTTSNGTMSSTDKAKLDGIASGAEVNVQSDWNESDSTADDFIKNKPTIPTKNLWYATCSTEENTAAKVASTTSNDFTLTTGNMVRVKFENAQAYNGIATLNVDGTGAKDIARLETTKISRYYWTAGEVVDLVYDGTNFVMSNKGTATTTYYGLTKLSSSTSSTSTAIAATPSAVKAAYDLADSKQDELVSGTNIKTINNTSLLGSGNIDIQGGGGTYTATSPIDITNGVISHDDSGVTAGSKGDTSAQTPGFGSTFKVLSGTVDSKGHLTSFAEHTVKIPTSWATTANAGLMSEIDKAALDELVANYDLKRFTGTLEAGNTSLVIDCSSYELSDAADVVSVTACDLTHNVPVIVDWAVSTDAVNVSIASAVNYDIGVQVVLAPVA